MPIKLGSSELSPVTSLIDQYGTDRLPSSATNGELIYCPDGNGLTVPNTTTISGAHAYRNDGQWVRTNNNQLTANGSSLWRQGFAFAQFDATAAGNGPFNPQIIEDVTSGGVRKRKLYIDITFNSLTFRIYCLYCVPTSTPPAGGFPCLFIAQGWTGYPSEYPDYNAAGWATFGFDYAGARDDALPTTEYPVPQLAYGIHRPSQGGYTINTTLQDGSQISDARQTSEYLWCAIMRRAFEYMVTQPEINTAKIGMRGHSYGGTIAWSMAQDPRLKAVVSWFGNGWNTYYRDKLLWKYKLPATTYPAWLSGEKIYLNAIDPSIEAKGVIAPILLINGSADHHGGHDRVDDTFANVPANVPWDFSHDANKNHNVSLNVPNEKLWLDKYVLGTATTWPKRPASWISKVGGVPQLNVQPDTTLTISSVEFWKAEVQPFNVDRVWVSVSTTNDGRTWVGQTPVADNSKYLFAYANIIYTNGVVTSTRFNAVIPNNLN
jgi:dienelactone hydrolase